MAQLVTDIVYDFGEHSWYQADMALVVMKIVGDFGEHS